MNFSPALSRRQRRNTREILGIPKLLSDVNAQGSDHDTNNDSDHRAMTHQSRLLEQRTGHKCMAGRVPIHVHGNIKPTSDVGSGCTWKLALTSHWRSLSAFLPFTVSRYELCSVFIPTASQWQQLFSNCAVKMAQAGSNVGVEFGNYG